MNSIVDQIIRGYYYPQKLTDEQVDEKFGEFVKSDFTSLSSFLYDGGYEYV